MMGICSLSLIGLVQLGRTMGVLFVFTVGGGVDENPEENESGRPGIA